MNTGIIASRYAAALLKLVDETGSGEVVVSQAKAVLDALTNFPDLRRLLSDPSVPDDKKLSLLEAAVSVDSSVATLPQNDKGVQNGGNVKKPGFFDGFKTVFTTPTALMLTIGFSGLIFVITGYMTWVPAYLQEEFGQSQASAGFNSMFWTYVAAFAGVLLAGTLSDKLAAKNHKVRMTLQAAGLLGGAVFLFLMGGHPALWLLYISFAGWGFFRAFFDANTYSVLYDVTPEHLHASCSSAMIMTGFAVGALAPVILGALKESMGSLSATFPMLAVIWVVCSALMFIVAKTSYQKDYDKMHAK